ncbi:unnamed protein product [Effrenium voratum]|nr:unnamed protein product [Effrenium voratum]
MMDTSPLPAVSRGLLGFSSCVSCSFLRTEEKEVQVGQAQVQETETMLGTWRSTQRSKTKVQEHFWNWTSQWRLFLVNSTLASGHKGSQLKSLGDVTEAPTASGCQDAELDISWLLRLRHRGAAFLVNRSRQSCRTPRRNEEVQEAVSFFQRLTVFARRAVELLRGDGSSDWAAELEDARKASVQMFKPILALFALENNASGRPVLSADVDTVLDAYQKSLDDKLHTIERSESGGLARLVLLLWIPQPLPGNDQGGGVPEDVADVGMLYQQLTSALGKSIHSSDFGEYMDFHGRMILGDTYAPAPFVYAVRRHQHHPEGTLSIEAKVGAGGSEAPLRSFALHLPEGRPMRSSEWNELTGVGLSSATSVTLTGEHYLHAAIFHRFAKERPQELQLHARARQLSSFVLMVGKIAAPDASSAKFEVRRGSDHPGVYEHGRLNLPFVGHTTFGKYPPADLSKLTAGTDFAVLGVPNDMGTQYRSGARMGPRGIREASTLYQFGHSEVYDADTEETYSYGTVVDVGDVDVVHTDQAASLNRTRAAVEEILRQHVAPVILGGDHAITAAICQALQVLGQPVVLVQIDAHLDFVDERHGVRYGHGNAMRRCLELTPQVGSMLQLGIRSVSSTAKVGFEEARAMGSSILSVRQVRQMGIQQVAEMVPRGSAVYFSIDIDGLDPSIAPGTGTPSHGGFLYYEVKDLLRAITQRARIVGLDLVEVSPPYDPAQVTAMLAARLVLDTMGFIRKQTARADRFEPTAALIIQNKDDLAIPLLLETVPTPKEFIDSIQSLSPEQQRFAKAWRKMQLSSSLFAVCVVQIKPLLDWAESVFEQNFVQRGRKRLNCIEFFGCWSWGESPESRGERVLNLPEFSLTKEIQLTQDLIELFVKYQVPPDLMSYDGGGARNKAGEVLAGEKLDQVKSHVAKLWDTISQSRKKQLQEKQEEAKMRNMQSCGAEECPRSDADRGEWPMFSYSMEAAEMKAEARPQDPSPGKPPGAKHNGPAPPRAFPAPSFCREGTVSRPEAARRRAQAEGARHAPWKRKSFPVGPEGGMDYTQLPHLLDANYLKFDTEAKLRPTTIKLGPLWTKQEQPGFLGALEKRQLDAGAQRTETQQAFDLLDALSRSGAMTLDQTSLHVVLAATHCFDETVIDTAVKQNDNPIEKLERRSMLIVASTIHRKAPSLLLRPPEVERIRFALGSLSPALFEPSAQKKLF